MDVNPYESPRQALPANRPSRAIRWLVFIALVVCILGFRWLLFDIVPQFIFQNEPPPVPE